MRERYTKKINEKLIAKRYCLSSAMGQSIDELFERPKLRHPILPSRKTRI
jgi:hypothetical protein